MNANQPGYAKYACVNVSPLSCENARRAGSGACAVCGFPALLAPSTRLRAERLGAEIEIEKFLRSRGNGVLYRGIRLGDRQPAILKEYLLPSRYFSQSEASLRGDRFRRVATLGLADGRRLECRLLVPDDICIQVNDPNDLDAPSFGRCYQIVLGEQLAFPSLRECLEKHGPLTPERVRAILARVLQSLTCLHAQKIRFRSGAVWRGIAHGNLTLDTLLLDSLENPALVYLSDLALWETAFDPRAHWEEWVDLAAPTGLQGGGVPGVQKDLRDLGAVAVALLSGGEISTDSLPSLGSGFSDRPQLDDFIRTLFGQRLPAFESADEAAAALPDLPPRGGAIAAAPVPVKPPAKEKRHRKLIFALAVALLAMLLGALLGLWLWQRGRERQIAGPEICCFDRVNPLPAEALYLSAANGAWDFVFRQRDLVASGQSLQELVDGDRPELAQWCYGSHSRLAPAQPPCRRGARLGVEGKSVLDLTRAGAIDFAILDPSTAQFDAAYGVFPLAYDSLVVFVAFNYQKREDGLTQALSGQISLAQLRQLYTGKIARWQQLDPRLPNLPVRLYVPQDEAAIALFEARVLQDPKAIAEFRARLPQSEAIIDGTAPLQGAGAIARLPTPQLLRQVIADFEDPSPPIGSIGFDSLARTFNQCSVYPLALQAGDRDPVSPLAMNDGRAISPRTDLCREKGNYRPNYGAIAARDYPLSYPLAVAYRRDNRRADAGKSFARLLRTTQGQCLLQKTGLTPLAPDVLNCEDNE